MNDREFLELAARMDEHITPEEWESSGIEYWNHLSSEVAREMLKRNDVEDSISCWSEETQRRWREGKFFKLWQDIAEGRADADEWEKRGWEP